MKNNEKMQKNRGRFCIKMILNHLEMFCKCISQLDVVNTCVLCIWDAFIDSLHNPLRILRKKTSHIFRSKSKGCIYKNGHKYFSQGFRQNRPLIQRTLMSKLIEKTQTKSIACHVRSNPFYWAFEPVDPWLRRTVSLNRTGRLCQVHVSHVKPVLSAATRCSSSWTSSLMPTRALGLPTSCC